MCRSNQLISVEKAFSRVDNFSNSRSTLLNYEEANKRWQHLIDHCLFSCLFVNISARCSAEKVHNNVRIAFAVTDSIIH